MFLSCLDLNISQIVDSLGDLRGILLSNVIVYLVSPILIYLLKDYFSPEIFLGLIIAASLPAGRSAVFLSNIYGGIPVKALVSSSLSNIISPVLVPLLVWFFAHTTLHIDPFSMGKTIIWMVLVPLIIAFLFGKTSSGKKLNTYSPTLSTFIVFLIILGIVSPIKEVIIQNPSLTLILLGVVSVLVTIDFFLGFTLKKDFPNRITYGLTSSYKNYTLGTLLALTLFTPIVALPSIIYTIVNNLLLVPLQFLTPRTPFSPHTKIKIKNILFLFISLFLTYILSQSPNFHNFIINFGSSFGIISSFFAGMLFASTFTITLGALILINLNNFLPLIPLTISAIIGAVLTDIFIYKFIKHQVTDNVLPIFEKINHKSHLYKLLHTPYFSWTLSIVGIIVIASPLPDELGVSLLGLSQIKSSRFILITFLSHTVGVTSLLMAARVL
jgi:BASS family bile acid:Na+ symporter